MNVNFPPHHLRQLLLGQRKGHLIAVGAQEKKPLAPYCYTLGVTVSLLCFFPIRNGSPPHSPHPPTV